MGKRNKKGGSQVSKEGKNGLSINAPKKAHLDRCVGRLAHLTNYLVTSKPPDSLELDKLLNEIISLEQEIVGDLPSILKSDRGEHFSLLLSWVKSHGGQVDDLSIEKYGEGEYGVYSKRDATDGTIVCSIPKKVMLDLEDGETSELKELMSSDPMVKQMGNVGLALLLLLEVFKGENSFWAPYIATLPRVYNTVLIFKTADLNLLNGSSVREAASAQRVHIARQYSYFYTMIHIKKDPMSRVLQPFFTFEAYRWAVSTILTRQNMIPSSDESRKIPCLIPVWDMCNHTPGPITTGYNSDTKSGECFALHPLKSGEQIFISYGSRTNMDFFLHNGFVPEENPDDKYRLHLGLARSNPLNNLQTSLLSKVDVPSSGDFFLNAGPDPVNEDLVAFIRIFSMQKEHLEEWLESGKARDLRCIDCALDTEVEVKAWTFLATRLSLLLANYKTPSEIVSGPAASLATRLVNSEKKLLQSALEYAKLKAEHWEAAA